MKGESGPAYVAALRHLARHCEFQDWLDHLLCYHMVCGLRDETLQRRLLAESKLMLTKAIQMAQAFEEAAAKTQELCRARFEVHQEQNRVARTPCQCSSGRGSASFRTPPQCWKCTGAHDASALHLHRRCMPILRQQKPSAEGLLKKNGKRKMKIC